MTFNLEIYGLDDRDGDGQADDLKPAEERALVLDEIAAVRPDILAVQEMGNPIVFRRFRDALARRGLRYSHAEYLRRGHSEHNLAVLSRFPVAARGSTLDPAYTIRGETVPLLRGIVHVEIELPSGYGLHLLSAHLKSKVYHPLGQTEMRRNEARLLRAHIEDVLAADPDANLLLAGDLNDDPGSAPLALLRGAPPASLTDLRPADALGHAWTWHGAEEDRYCRFDFLLASPGLLAEWVPGKTGIPLRPAGRRGSDHRQIGRAHV